MIFLSVTNLKREQIDFSDRTFDIFYPTEALVKASEDRFTNTLVAVVQPKLELFRIVFGWDWLKRITELPNRVPAFTLSEEADISKAILYAVQYLRRFRDLYPIEVARILHMILDARLCDEKILTEILPAVNLSYSKQMVEQYNACLDIEEELVDYLITKKATLKLWFTLSTLSGSFRKFLIPLIKKARPTLSVFDEIVRHVQEISIREKMETTAVLEKIGWETCLNDSKMTEQSRLAEIRERIARMRFPVTSDHICRLEALLEKIEMPPNIKLQYDKTLEKKELKIEAMIKSDKDIEALRKLFDDNYANRLKNILNML